MADKLAKFGWMAKVVVLHGPTDTGVQYYMVARETEAEAIATVRSVPGIEPEDDVLVGLRLSQGEIEAYALQVDEIRLFLPEPKTT